MAYQDLPTEGRVFTIARAVAVAGGGNVQAVLPLYERFSIYIQVSAATNITVVLSPNEGAEVFNTTPLVIFGAAGTEVVLVEHIANFVRLVSTNPITITALVMGIPFQGR